MAHSIRIRELAVVAIEKGKDRKEIVETFNISLASLKRWLKQKSEQGHLRIGKPPGAARKLDETALKFVKQQIKKKPDINLKELCQVLTEQGYYPISVKTMQRVVKRLGLSRKKNALPSQT